MRGLKKETKRQLVENGLKQAMGKKAKTGNQALRELESP